MPKRKYKDGTTVVTFKCPKGKEKVFKKWAYVFLKQFEIKNKV